MMSSEFDFDSPVDRHNTDSLKWEKYRGRDIIPLWVADMDFRTPPAVISALGKKIDQGILGYGVVPERLNLLVCTMLADKYGWQVEMDHLIWLPGLVSGLNIACRAVGGEGDAVMSMVPIYPPFLSAPGNSERELITVPLIQDSGGWEIDFDLLEESISPRTRLLLFCNPQNPVGRIFSRQELAELAAICKKHDIIICSDEVHCDLILDKDKQHVPMATISPEAAACTITLMAPSKTFNIPGLGCSFAVVSSKQLRKNFRKAMAGIVPEVNILGLAAGEAAYRDGWDWLNALLEYLRGNRDFVEQRIGAITHLAMHHVEATYLAWIDARSIDEKFPGRVFEKYGVGFSEGSDFGQPGFLRLNFGCRRALLEEALDRMEKAVEKSKC